MGKIQGLRDSEDKFISTSYLCLGIKLQAAATALAPLQVEVRAEMPVLPVLPRVAPGEQCLGLLPRDGSEETNPPSSTPQGASKTGAAEVQNVPWLNQIHTPLLKYVILVYFSLYYSTYLYFFLLQHNSYQKS